MAVPSIDAAEARPCQGFCASETGLTPVGSKHSWRVIPVGRRGLFRKQCETRKGLRIETSALRHLWPVRLSARIGAFQAPEEGSTPSRAASFGSWLLGQRENSKSSVRKVQFLHDPPSWRETSVGRRVPRAKRCERDERLRFKSSSLRHFSHGSSQRKDAPLVRWRPGFDSPSVLQSHVAIV